MRVTLASIGVAPYLGDDLTVVVTPKTQLLQTHGRLFRTITMSDIRLGDHVRVTGAIDLTVPAQPVFTASRVVASHVARPDQIKWFAFRGPVKSIDADRRHDRRPAPARDAWPLGRRRRRRPTFVVAPAARIFTWPSGKPVVLTLADLAAGDHVLAQGSIDRSVPATPVFTIKWMRVWEPVPAT